MSVVAETHQDVPVRLSVAASYTKSTAQADYAWRGDERALPPAIGGLADELTRVPMATAITISATGTSWLLLARPLSTDAAGRRFLVIDVCRFVDPPSPSPELALLTCAQAALWSHELDTEVTTDIRHATGEAAITGVEDVLRARLGAPLSTSGTIALDLTRRAPFRYAGICYITKSSDGMRPNWSPLFPNLLCVNCADPVLDNEVRADLGYLMRSPLSAAQWTVLDDMDTVAAARAVRWVRTGMLSALPQDASPDLQRFAVATLGAHLERGPRLLDDLLRRLGGRSLPSPGAIAAACGTVSAEASALVAMMARGEAVTSPTESLRELARKGFLQNVDALPMRLWLSEGTAGDPEIVHAAIERMERDGIPASVARLLLDVDAGPAGSPSLAELTSVLAAKKVPPLPPPCRRFPDLLAQAIRHEDLEALESVASSYGGETAAMMRVARHARFASGELSPISVIAALAAHARVYGGSRPLLRYIGDLLESGRDSEVPSIIAAAQGSTLQIPPDGAAVIKSRLGLGSPVRFESHLALEDLIAEGIARPGDVVPENRAALRAAASLWPQTSWLVDVLDSRAADDAPTTSLPPAWLTVARLVITGRTAAKIIEQSSERAESWFRRWIAEMHGVDGNRWCAFLDGTGETPPADEVFLAEFVTSLSTRKSRAQRLRMLQTLAASRILVQRENLARKCAGLVGRDRAQVDLATYLLSDLGPMPLLSGVPGDLLLAAVPLVRVELLITGLLLLESYPYETTPELPLQIALRVRETAASIPSHNYTQMQVRSHALLAVALSQEQGWAALAVDRETREWIAEMYRRQLGLDHLDAGSDGESDADSE